MKSMPLKPMHTKSPATKSANKAARKPGHNVVKLVTQKLAPIAHGAAAGAAAERAIKGRPDDARVQEAMRLAQAFLAIEDPGARAALVALAERLISYDWIRKVK